MPIRFYIAPQQGDGLSPQTAFRSILNDFINVQAGEHFQEIDNPARRLSICCVTAADATHAAIVADARVIAISRLYADQTAAIEGLQESLNNIPGIAAVKTRLEEIGINTGWITGSNSLKDAIRYIFRIFSTSQIAAGEGNANIKDIIARNLDVTVSQIPAGVRTGVRDWMQAKGLAIGWINNQTTVREILHFIVGNIGFGYLKMTSIEF